MDLIETEGFFYQTGANSTKPNADGAATSGCRSQNTPKNQEKYRLFTFILAAKNLTSNSLNAIPSWPKPRNTRGFALRAPDCAFPPGVEKAVSNPFCLKTS